jgi:hypothetical protein
VLVAADQAEDDGFHSISGRTSKAHAELADLGFDLGEVRRQGGRAGDQHNVEGYSRASTYRTIRSIRQELGPDGLPDAAAGSITGDRATDLPAGADANPGAGGPPRSRKADHGGAGIESAPREQTLKVAPGGQPETLFHRPQTWPEGQVMSARAQPGSALAATVLDDACAAHRAHPLHETVDPAAITLLGLVRPLDFRRPLFFVSFFQSRDFISKPIALNSRSIGVVFAAC